MENLVYLRFRNFPREFSNVDIKEFLSHLGGRNIQCGQKRFKSKEKGNAIAAFHDLVVADAIIKKLHQAKVLGICLCIKYVDVQSEFTKKKSRAEVRQLRKRNKRDLIDTQQLYTLYKKLNIVFQSNVQAGEINFPPINQDIVANINKMLINNLQFYQNVCHLMNTLGLPCPFIPDSYQEISLPPLMPSEMEEDEESEIEIEDSLPCLSPTLENSRLEKIKEKLHSHQSFIHKTKMVQLGGDKYSYLSKSKYMPPPPPKRTTSSIISTSPRPRVLERQHVFEEIKLRSSRNINIPKIIFTSDCTNNFDTNEISSPHLSPEECIRLETLPFKFDFKVAKSSS